jgi:hypothetical protein
MNLSLCACTHLKISYRRKPPVVVNLKCFEAFKLFAVLITFKGQNIF